MFNVRPDTDLPGFRVGKDGDVSHVLPESRPRSAELAMLAALPPLRFPIEPAPAPDPDWWKKVNPLAPFELQQPLSRPLRPLPFGLRVPEVLPPIDPDDLRRIFDLPSAPVRPSFPQPAPPMPEPEPEDPENRYTYRLYR